MVERGGTSIHIDRELSSVYRNLLVISVAPRPGFKICRPESAIAVDHDRRMIFQKSAKSFIDGHLIDGESGGLPAGDQPVPHVKGQPSDHCCETIERSSQSRRRNVLLVLLEEILSCSSQHGIYTILALGAHRPVWIFFVRVNDEFGRQTIAAAANRDDPS